MELKGIYLLNQYLSHHLSSSSDMKEEQARLSQLPYSLDTSARILEELSSLLDHVFKKKKITPPRDDPLLKKLRMKKAKRKERRSESPEEEVLEAKGDLDQDHSRKLSKKLKSEPTASS